MMSDQFEPLFKFPTRRETEKVMDAVSEYVRSEENLKRMLSKTIAAACGIAALDDRALMERLKEVWIDGYRAGNERKGQP